MGEESERDAVKMMRKSWNTPVFPRARARGQRSAGGGVDFGPSGDDGERVLFGLNEQTRRGIDRLPASPAPSPSFASAALAPG